MSFPEEAGTRGREVKSFLEHLEDLRSALIGCIVALVAGIAIAAPLTPQLLHWLTWPLQQIGGDSQLVLRSLDVGGAVSVSLRITFWAGLILSAPFLTLFIGRFIFPGLTDAERRVARGIGALAVGLFAAGVFLGYRFMLPAALRMMLVTHAWLGIRAEWTVTSYTAFASQMLLGFGFVFELPTVLLALGKLGLVNSRQLRTYRRHAVVAALVVGMVLTPPDVFSQLLMSIPLMILYELCIWAVWLAERQRERQVAG
ncbi:MAG TPA: twin-arginine translocase subunit TatC [Kiritimatiellia bacterium]|nr:twin-arginine translocase subunit TatC [Kiritimatiellia bacterium]